MSDTKAKAGDKVQVTLQKPHTHGGKDCQAGDKIAVRPDQLERLKKHGKA